MYLRRQGGPSSETHHRGRCFVSLKLSCCLSPPPLQHTAPSLLTAANSSPCLFAINRRGRRQLCQSVRQPQCQSTAQTRATILSRDGLWPVEGHQSFRNCFWDSKAGLNVLCWNSCLLHSPYSSHRGTSVIRPLSKGRPAPQLWKRMPSGDGCLEVVALLVDISIFFTKEDTKPCFSPNFCWRQGSWKYTLYKEQRGKVKKRPHSSFTKFYTATENVELHTKQNKKHIKQKALSTEMDALCVAGIALSCWRRQCVSGWPYILGLCSTGRRLLEKIRPLVSLR